MDKAQNQICLLGSSSGPNTLGCNKPTRSAAGFEGKPLRVDAGNFSRWSDFASAWLWSFNRLSPDRPRRLMGGLFFGYFTPTAGGAAICTVFAFVRGVLPWRSIGASVTETISTTSAIFIIAIDAKPAGAFRGISQVGKLISAMISNAGTSFALVMVGIVVL